MPPPPTIQRLIATWCFAEAGLGGLMHTLHIPLTGFLIGGLSVLINTFLAIHSRSHAATMLSALGTVLLVKFALSPQSPIGAYVAVGFQGLLAVALYKSLGVNRISITLFALLVMLENAVQKPLMATLVFGKELWEGLLLFARDSLHLGDNAALSLYLILGLYLLLYLAWGWLLATWTWQFIRRLSLMKTEDHEALPLTQNEITVKNKRKYTMAFSLALAAAVILLVFWKLDPALDYFLRVITLLLLVGFVLPLVLRFVFRRLLRKHSARLLAIQEAFPLIRQNFRMAWQRARKEKGLVRLRQFLFLSVYLNIFSDAPTAAAHR